MSRTSSGTKSSRFLLGESRRLQSQAKDKAQSVAERVRTLDEQGNLPLSNANGAADSLAQWMHDDLKCEVDLESLSQLDAEELEQRLGSLVEDRYHPEMRRMERMVLLEIVDMGWKDHLLAMDHLRSAVGTRGMAQLDPKVEYKREGMRMFEQLWDSIGERVTDLIFRMEQLNENFIRETVPVSTNERHDNAPPPGDMAKQQEDAIRGSQDIKVETIRNRGLKLGRNDPCHCGSGKKYKNCHLRTDQELV